MAADRPDFLGTEVEGRRLKFHLTAENAASARATLEDLLACLSAAERTLGISPKRGAAARPPE